MNGDVLRRAAALMRGRAEAATPGPWFLDALDRAYVGNRADGRTHGLWAIVHMSGDVLPDLTDDAQRRTLADAAHIASWHPAVALVVAGVLERAASFTCVSQWWGEGCDSGTDCMAHREALAVARAYLGDAA